MHAIVCVEKIQNNREADKKALGKDSGWIILQTPKIGSEISDVFLATFVSPPSFSAPNVAQMYIKQSNDRIEKRNDQIWFPTLHTCALRKYLNSCPWKQGSKPREF